MKMKKIKLLLLLLGVFILSGCNITKDNMEDIEIYTTIYPIKYLITSLYGDHAGVNSIYPAGVDTNEFNKETLDLFLKYNVVSVDSVDKLIKDNKLKIDGIDEVLVKYRKEEK